MTNPSVVDLLKQCDCRYTLVVDVAKRARQLLGGQQPLIATKEKKPLIIAIDEVNEGLIQYLRPPEDA
jgi:DNA-directed RNA polymerase subunit omega